MMVEYRPGKLQPVFWLGGGPNMVDVDSFMALVDGFGVMRSHVNRLWTSLRLIARLGIPEGR